MIERIKSFLHGEKPNLEESLLNLDNLLKKQSEVNVPITEISRTLKQTVTDINTNIHSKNQDEKRRIILETIPEDEYVFYIFHFALSKQNIHYYDPDYPDESDVDPSTATSFLQMALERNPLDQKCCKLNNKTQDLLFCRRESLKLTIVNALINYLDD